VYTPELRKRLEEILDQIKDETGVSFLKAQQLLAENLDAYADDIVNAAVNDSIGAGS